jgi:predicted dehydrogenase
LDVENLKVAVVGLGKMGLLHASILNVLPMSQLTAVCEKNFTTRRFLKKILPEVSFVGAVEELSDLELDAVFITTPIPSHSGIAKSVYRDGIARNLFVEKTLAHSYSESKELCVLATNSGGVNMVGYPRRSMVTFRKAKELLEGEVIGEPVSFSIDALSSDFYGITDNPRASNGRGGVLRDLGSHAIDVALWFFDDVHVESSKIESQTGLGAEDSVHSKISAKSDSVEGILEISWCAKGYRMPEVALTIRGLKGTIKVNDDNVSLQVGAESSSWFRHDLCDHVSFWLGAPEFYREDEHFIKSILNGSGARPDFDTASKVDKLIEEIQGEA